MLYNYNYDIAGLITGVFLLIVYLIRRTLKTKSNKFLFILLICNILGSLTDWISTYCISYPDKYPLWFDYLICYAYLFFYNSMGILFLAYVNSKTKVKKISKCIGGYVNVICLVEFILIFISPLTHWVSFFDENHVYTHGPFMMLLYALAFLHLLLSAILFVFKRKRFNLYQIMAMVSFIVVVFLGVLIQILVPSLLVGQFGCALVLFFIYISFENPVYHTYRETTCYNRRAFLEVMKSAIRHDETQNALIFTIKDFDNYREQLDIKELGRLSSNVAEYISSLCKADAFTLSDSKYLILVKGENDALQIKDKLEDACKMPLKLVDNEIKITLIFKYVEDITQVNNPALIQTGIENILNHNLSDEWKVDFEETVSKIKRRRDIARILREAIENDLFDVYYQPIYDSNSGKFKSAEALIRLKSQEYGFISPEEFIPIAENDGLIVKIGDMVFEKVCRFIGINNVIKDLGVSYIEINLSPIQCIQTDVVEKFKKIMDKYDVQPSWINLEITETAQIEENDKLIRNILLFHELGVEFSLDDYGSGFASADYLFRLPVELVKIDKTILWQGMMNENACIVLVGTLGLLKSLNKKIVVEGVEDKDMVELLLDNGVDYLQGYYYSKPINEFEYLQFLMEKNI